MYIQNLELNNYRNYQHLTINFDQVMNIFLGENAQGKTNLLEAIYVLALTKSYRTNQDKELISWNQEKSSLQTTVFKRDGKFPIEIELSNKGKQVKANHLTQAKLSDYIGKLNVVLFAPEDLNLIKGSPSTRRLFIDREFGQISVNYLFNLTQYRQVLKQRNAYLKSQKSLSENDTLLQVYTDQLIEYGSEIIFQRIDLLRKLETFSAILHEKISQQKETLQLNYLTNFEYDVNQLTVELIQDRLRDNFKKSIQREIRQFITLIGPHRDDIQFLVNGVDVEHFGSQGQQRTTALSVKLAEIDLMQQQTGEYPILLLDDVLSELDASRQTSLLSVIQQKVQTFITTPSLSDVAKKMIQQPKIFTIQNGKIVGEE